MFSEKVEDREIDPNLFFGQNQNLTREDLFLQGFPETR